MKLKEAKNLRWACNKKEGISADVLFEEIGDYIPFHATPNDIEEHGREVFSLLSSGKYGDIGDPIDNSLALKNIEKRSRMAEAERVITPLARAEKLNIATEEEKQKLWEWETYSVHLSRMTDTDDFPAKPNS